MDIRYFSRGSDMYPLSYFCVEGDDVYNIYDDGQMFDTPQVASIIRRVCRELDEIPDVWPIEERYINATDRPSREGFKHPDVVEPWI